GKKPMRARQTELLAAPRMHHFHLAHEPPAANAQERHAVAMLRIEIRLNLEDEAGELAALGRHISLVALPRTRRRTEPQEAAQELLHAIIVQRAAKEHRRHLPGQEPLAVELRP